jgi:hypothetical protein
VNFSFLIFNYFDISESNGVVVPRVYLVLKNLVLPRMAGSSMGQACPALRGSEFSGSAEIN